MRIDGCVSLASGRCSALSELLEIDTLATLIPWSIYPEVQAAGGTPASPAKRQSARHCFVFLWRLCSRKGCEL